MSNGYQVGQCNSRPRTFSDIGPGIEFGILPSTFLLHCSGRSLYKATLTLRIFVTFCSTQKRLEIMPVMVFYE